MKRKNQNLKLAIAFFLGLVIGLSAVYVYQPAVIEIVRYEMPILGNGAEYQVSMFVPAVDADNNGVVAELITRVRSGSGLVLVSINDVLAEADTQQSARTAARVAANYTGIDMAKYDIIYTMKVNASVIGGPSAGSAMAISTILALQNRSANESVMMTGTINSDGTIGPAGAIAAKAKAAKEVGAEIFLVPLGHSSEVQYKEQKHCEQYGSVEYCQIEYIPERIDIAAALGITIAETQNIAEALKYF